MNIRAEVVDAGQWKPLYVKRSQAAIEPLPLACLSHLAWVLVHHTRTPLFSPPSPHSQTGAEKGASTWSPPFPPEFDDYHDDGFGTPLEVKTFDSSEFMFSWSQRQ